MEFEVLEGIVEIEVRHDNLSSANILDWGLDDANGFRGWGGGNSEEAIVGVEAAWRSYVPPARFRRATAASRMRTIATRLS